MPRAFGALVLAIVLAAGTAAWAGPTDQLRQYTDQVLRVLDDPTLQGVDRRAAVRRIAVEIFDVAETAKRALARHWQARTAAEREEFVRLFADLLESTYISRIDEYGGEKIRYVGEKVDGGIASVQARILTRKGVEVPVESRMVLRGDRWLIYDVLIENISLVGNYRAQFDRIVRTSSYEELVRRLKSHRDQLRQEAPAKSSRTAG